MKRMGECLEPRSMMVLACLTLAASLSVAPQPVPASEPAYTQLISYSMTGGVSSGDHNPWDVEPRGPDISADGRYVVWTSSATDLVSGGTTAYNKYDVFWRDRVAGITKRVSDSSAGVNGNDTSWAPRVSADGRYVAYMSKATNLVEGDTNGVQDVFVHDTVTGETERASISDSEAQAITASYGPPAISDDGRYVAFATSPSSLGLSSDWWHQVYVRDRQDGTTELVSVNSAEEAGNDFSYVEDMSGDGNSVVFRTYASNIHGDAGNEHMAVRNRAAGTTAVVNRTTSGQVIFAYLGSISDDGRYVAFQGEIKDAYQGYSAWVRDIQESTTEVVSKSSAGVSANESATNTHISGDGRYVVFDSAATNLVTGDTNEAPDVFRHDRVTHETERMSLTVAGEQAPYTSWLAHVSSDGQAVVFSGQGLVPEDNTGGQIYVRAFGEMPFDTATIEHDASGVTFDRWVTGFNDSYSGGGYVYGRWTGTELRTSFVGKRVRWIGPKWPAYGMADVYIDDVLVASDVDCYAPDAEKTLSAVIWESETLSDGPHALSIRLTGQKNPASPAYYVVVDRLEVDGVQPRGGGTRYDERDGAMTGSWVYSANPTYYGKTYSYSRWTNANFSLTFSGTKVAWIGPRTTNYGMADVYIDGAKVATVDQYRANLATQGWREVVWASDTLAPGSHTLEIKPLGTKNSGALDFNVVIDAFDVRE